MAENIKNALEDLTGIYEKCVKKEDKKGFVQAYKKAAELFFRKLITSIKDYSNIDIEVTNVEYLDGYFMFGIGTNSVVHFKIDKCPGWKFGIWWKVPNRKKYKEHKVIYGEFFTQFEEELDKFKPSRSVMHANISVDLTSDSDGYFDVWDACKIIEFIAKYPYLAFFRDYQGCDFNFEYVSLEEAEKFYNDYRAHKDLTYKLQEEYNKKCIAFMQENVIPEFNGAFIIDEGTCTSPRFSIIVPLEENLDIIDQPGCYGFEADDEHDIENRYRELTDKLKHEANAQNCYLDRAFSACVEVVESKYIEEAADSLVIVPDMRVSCEV